jgi:hypothetical protein
MVSMDEETMQDQVARELASRGITNPTDEEQQAAAQRCLNPGSYAVAPDSRIKFRRAIKDESPPYRTRAEKD